MSRTVREEPRRLEFKETIKMNMLPTLSFRNSLKGSMWQKTEHQWQEIHEAIRKGDLERVKNYIARVAGRRNHRDDYSYFLGGIMISIEHDQVEIFEFLRNLSGIYQDKLSFYFVWAVVYNSSKFIDTYIKHSQLNLNEQWDNELPNPELRSPDASYWPQNKDRYQYYDMIRLSDTIFGGLTKMSPNQKHIFPILKKVLQNGHDRIIDLDRFKAYIFYQRELMAGKFYTNDDRLDSLIKNKEYNELLDEVNKSMEAQKALGLTSELMRRINPLLHSQSEFEYRSVENIISESKKPPKYEWGVRGNGYVIPTRFNQRYGSSYSVASGPIDMSPGDRRGGKRNIKSRKIRKYKSKTRKNCR
jgi:hypothetical protein